jgi:hypothetical protein
MQFYLIRAAVGNGNSVHFNNIPGRSQSNPIHKYGTDEDGRRQDDDGVTRKV